MKYILSLIISCTMLVGANAQPTVLPNFTNVNNTHTVSDSDRGFELPDCLFIRIAKDLQTEDFTTEFLFVNSAGKRVYRYQIGSHAPGYFSVSSLSCSADIEYADDPADLLFKLEDN